LFATFSSSSTRIGKVKVTDSRAAVYFAASMRELSDIHFPKSERTRVVLDNLSTHSASPLYQAFPAAEARRAAQARVPLCPRRASWLNMVEIGVLRRQCLERRIATKQKLVSQIAAWQRQRNASGARIKWVFTTEKARTKIGCAYSEPLIAPKSHAKES
jgi:DDE superfamily endonuclease